MATQPMPMPKPSGRNRYNCTYGPKKNLYIYIIIHIYAMYICVYIYICNIWYIYKLYGTYINYMVHIYIYGLVFRVPTAPNGMGPQVAPRSLLFASYWQHF